MSEHDDDFTALEEWLERRIHEDEAMMEDADPWDEIAGDAWTRAQAYRAVLKWIRVRRDGGDGVSLDPRDVRVRRYRVRGSVDELEFEVASDGSRAVWVRDLDWDTVRGFVRVGVAREGNAHGVVRSVPVLDSEQAVSALRTLGVRVPGGLGVLRVDGPGVCLEPVGV